MQSSVAQAHCVSVPQVLRQLQQGLAKCYSVAFEKSGAVSDAKITPHTLNFVKKLVSTFGVGLENVSNVSTMFSSAASESLARRAQATAQDPVFQKLKGQFTTGESRPGEAAPHPAPRSYPSQRRLTASVAFLERSTGWAG